jgi:hypothetical protein
MIIDWVVLVALWPGFCEPIVVSLEMRIRVCTIWQIGKVCFDAMRLDSTPHDTQFSGAMQSPSAVGEGANLSGIHLPTNSRL